MKPVRVTRTAIPDALEIWVYPAERNRRAAAAWNRALTGQYDLLSLFPESGALDPTAGPNVRSITFGD
jgi:plasmid stabilization system protein ParE